MFLGKIMKKNSKDHRKGGSICAPEINSGRLAQYKSSLYNSKKKAGVTVEFVLSTMLGIVVLFLILNLFNTNLKNMAANSQMNNLFNQNKTTSNQAYNKDYTASQVNVQIVGEQGLDKYRTEAMGTITSLGPQDTLDNSQMVNLAEALTTYGVAGKSAFTLENNANCKYARDKHNIEVDFGKRTTSINNTLKINWEDLNVPLLNTPDVLDDDLITQILTIKAKFNSVKN